MLWIKGPNVMKGYLHREDLTAEVVDEQTGKSSADGVIALQIHKGPPMVVRFKNITLRKP